MPLQKCCSNLLGSLTFLDLSICKLLHIKNVIQFYGWILITIEHWNIVQLASYNNILGPIVLILVTIPPSTNHHFIKGIKILFWKTKAWLWYFKLKFRSNIWFGPPYFAISLDLGFVYENLQCLWILEAYDNATHFENRDLKFGIET
jgi:hypothetical protein